MKNKKIYLFALSLLFACLLSACNDEILAQEIPVIPQESAEGVYSVTENGMEIMTDAMEAATQGTIYVHVCGAVNFPGVYQLNEGERINDAVELAGGFDEEADREAVNLVSPVSDGEQIRIPYIGEMIYAEESGLININDADEEDLCEIPGIGQSRAEAIVDYRKEHGDFNTPEELMLVPGIKEGIYARICPYIECR